MMPRTNLLTPASRLKFAAFVAASMICAVALGGLTGGSIFWALRYANPPAHSAIYGTDPKQAAAKLWDRNLELVVCQSQARLQHGDPGKQPVEHHIDFGYPVTHAEYQDAMDCMADKGFRVENGVIYAQR